MSLESDLQLIEDLDGMERKILRGWTRRMWIRPGFPWPAYCLTGAMNKQILGKASPHEAEKRLGPSTKERRKMVLSELGFNSTDSAEAWNDNRSRKEQVIDRIADARFRVLKRVQAEQLRLTREAAAEAERQRQEREAIARGRFVQEWLDKPREEAPLVVPEEWTHDQTKEPAPDIVRG